jgi:MFS family permease
MFGTLLPFYLIDVLKMGDNEDLEKVSYNLALVPMIAYASSVLVSTQLNWFYTQFGRKKALFLGTFICAGCLSAMIFLTEDTAWVMYVLAVFIGMSYDIKAARRVSSFRQASI